MKCSHNFTLVLILTFNIFFAQVGIGTTDPKSILDIQSTSSGLLIPRMTESQRDDISPLETSLLIFQTDLDSGFYFYNGTSWEKLLSGSVNASDVLFDPTSTTLSDTNVQSVLETIDQNLVFRKLSTVGYGVYNKGLKSPSLSEVSIGQFNTDYTANSTSALDANDRIFSIGIGDSDTNRLNALQVFKDGTFLADDLEISEITFDKQLVTKEYVDSLVTGTIAGFSVGDSYLGGIIFKVWDGGNHGLVVAPVEYTGKWDLSAYSSTNCGFEGIGAGLENTKMIFNAGIHKKDTTPTSFLINYYGIQTYTTLYNLDGKGGSEKVGGWYIPSIDELEELINVVETNNNDTDTNNDISFPSSANDITDGTYWSSNENSPNSVHVVNYSSGTITTSTPLKNSTGNLVRLIKMF